MEYGQRDGHGKEKLDMRHFKIPFCLSIVSGTHIL